MVHSVGRYDMTAVGATASRTNTGVPVILRVGVRRYKTRKLTRGPFGLTLNGSETTAISD